MRQIYLIFELVMSRKIIVFNFFKKIKPDAVINAAGTVGGILANSYYKANFIYDNLSIQNNIIHSAYTHNCKHYNPNTESNKTTRPYLSSKPFNKIINRFNIQPT